MFLTTHDKVFAREVVVAVRRQMSPADVVHRAIFPVNAVCPRIRTPLSQDDLSKRRDAFLRPENLDQPAFAQDYAVELRIFVEASLGALFDDPAYATSLRKPSTMADFLGRLRAKVKSGENDLFRSASVVGLSNHPTLTDNSSCLKLLNKAHHPEKVSITFMDVHAIHSDLQGLQEALWTAHEEYRRWRLREPAQVSYTNVISLRPLKRPVFNVEIFPDLAAFAGTSHASLTASAQENLDGSWFDNKALFYINSHNFGFAAPIGSLAIASTEELEVVDRSLVIARSGEHILARRVLHAGRNQGTLTFAAETTDPRKRPPTRIAQLGEFQIHSVVGILFDDKVIAPKSKQEATPIDDAAVLIKVQTAFRVKDDSALPLALPGQIVLGGESLAPADFDRHIDGLVALMLDNGDCRFKRISAALPGALAHIRQFESIGGFGASFLAATEQLEDRDSDFPLVVAARLILGVLYET